MNIATLVGSLRKDSYNMQLAETMRERYRDKMNMEIVDIGGLPHFNQDQELDPPQVVKDFKKKISAADGVVIITPEYNWSVPGVLKNAIDWASRGEKVFIGKPAMTAGATLGMVGTVRAQLHLRDILASPGVQAKVLPPGGNEVLIAFAEQKFDPATRRLTDETTLAFLDNVVNAFVEWIKQTQPVKL